MDDSAASQDADLADDSAKAQLDIIEVVPEGDLLLDVTFETSKATLKAARKAARPRPGRPIAQPALRPKVRLSYRVDLATLKGHSRYFSNLLGDTRFSEARSIAEALEKLSIRKVKPSEADAKELPVVKIHEDDEAARTAGRETAFEDLLRILHGKDAVTKPTMQYLATLAVLADRFDCTAPVSRYLTHGFKYKWPATQARLSKEDGHALSRPAEETLRQKILVAWLLDQPLKMHTATRELILYGSRKWSVSFDEEEASTAGELIWDLPDDLERELQYRRECILNTIASIQRHFLQLYTSRTRQCKLGYESSSSCDSYQLGEMVKFLVGRDLLQLVDFSTNSFGEIKDHSTVEIGQIIVTLRQCSGYQIDKNHTNCGLRIRLLPILDYIQSMLSSNIISISRPTWKKDRDSVSWFPSEEVDDHSEPTVFRFTRSTAMDQRFRFEGAMATDRLARTLFTADQWDWTPEY
ncbi:hypothetical protein B0H63DRAFT_470490 [Podospora didyma]|uniref:BTB domain-containing protein n=1 Tax=Podospora didyma TaxID=330526 RepID=A0AAE0NTT2_9PEZI|nr:hypothetical protein B0H63DRAFT_470490 [Podospora didyma]